MKISTKLFLYIFTLILITSIGMGFISVRDERFHLMGEARSQATSLASILAATFKYYHMENQHKRIGEIIHAVIPHGNEIDNMLLNIYDRQGQLMEFSFEHGTTKISPLKTIKLSSTLQGSKEKIMEVGDSEYLSVITPILTEKGELQGAVEVLLSLDRINISLAEIVQKFVAFILLTATLLGLIIFIINRWSISLPIERLKEASEKLGYGDLGLRINKSGVKELDDLIDQFNRMAKNIERQNKNRELLFNEKINLERQLRHTDKLAAIGQLASGLAHEIGTPLNVITGRAEHLLTKLPDDHFSIESIKNIIRQSDRITKIMQQMLAFSRKPDAKFCEVDLAQIIQEAFSLCKLRKGKTEQQIEMKLDISHSTLSADEDSLSQLFVNLMLNSFQAFDATGEILITSKHNIENSNMVVITYEDNGPGIGSDQKERIFDPFYTTKDVGEGTGLGLFIVANIIQEHQGRIEIDRSLEKGTRFIIHIPKIQISKSENIS